MADYDWNSVGKGAQPKKEGYRRYITSADSLMVPAADVDVRPKDAYSGEDQPRRTGIEVFDNVITARLDRVTKDGPSRGGGLDSGGVMDGHPTDGDHAKQ